MAECDQPTAHGYHPLARVRLSCYSYGMNATLTIRLDEDLRQRLRKLASQTGKTDSELVREVIERHLAAESVGRRLAHLKGTLPDSPPQHDSLAQSIRQRNWRT